jgi:SET domain-containing protein
VFARRAFSPGEVVERCPVLIVPAAQLVALQATDLHSYYYRWNGDAALAQGYGSLYNHSYVPNARIAFNAQLALVIIIAIEDITENEEITINYNGDPMDQSRLWFEPVALPETECPSETWP